MPKTVNLPSDYIPYHTLIICGNKLINGRIPFEVNDFVPFLVGFSEEGPLVWIQLPSTKAMDSWQYVVRANRVLHNAVKITKLNKDVKVHIKDKLVLHVVSENNETAKIVELDLRPMGLKIVGTIDELQVGGNTMKNNIFENVDAMIGIGVEDPR